MLTSGGISAALAAGASSATASRATAITAAGRQRFRDEFIGFRTLLGRAPRGAGTPPRPVAVIDGRAGRPPTAPKLTPEYLAKWEVMRQSRMTGSSETDPNANCLSAGMPGMMSMAYGMELQQTKDKITIYGWSYKNTFVYNSTAVRITS